MSRRSIALWLAPSMATTALPAVTCTACWPAYASFLSALGIGFVPIASRYLPWITVASLLVALAGIGHRARSTVPVAVGSLGALAILGGRFVLNLQALVYAGVALLVGAALARMVTGADAVPSCPACSPPMTPEKR